MVTHTLPAYTSATRVLEQAYLSEEEIVERLTIPGNLRASASEVSPRAKVEETADGEVHVRFNSDKNQSFTIAGPEAMESLFNFTGIPKSLGKDYPSKLITPLLTHALQKKDGVVTVIDGDGRLLNVSDQAKLKPVMAPEQVLENIKQQFPEVLWQDAQIASPKGASAYGADLVAITHNDVERLEARVNKELHQRLPQGGDPYRAGIHAHFNPMGITEPLIEPYVQRLVCLNGAIHSEFLSHEWGRGYGEGDDLWQWFREGLVASGAAINGVMQKYADMLSMTFETGQDRAGAVERYIRESRLNRADAEAVRNSAIAEQPQNQYDLFQLATATATHGTNRSLQDMLDRQRSATANATHSHQDRLCPTCHRN
jgi:hypothetical protein